MRKKQAFRNNCETEASDHAGVLVATVPAEPKTSAANTNGNPVKLQSGETSLMGEDQAASYLGLSKRQLRKLDILWKRNLARASSPFLPMSPANGLLRLRITSRTFSYDPRDVREYVRNAFHESSGLPSVSWRKEKSQ